MKKSYKHDFGKQTLKCSLLDKVIESHYYVFSFKSLVKLFNNAITIMQDYARQQTIHAHRLVIIVNNSTLCFDISAITSQDEPS